MHIISPQFLSSIPIYASSPARSSARGRHQSRLLLIEVIEPDPEAVEFHPRSPAIEAVVASRSTAPVAAARRGRPRLRGCRPSRAPSPPSSLLPWPPPIEAVLASAAAARRGCRARPRGCCPSRPLSASGAAARRGDECLWSRLGDRLLKPALPLAHGNASPDPDTSAMSGSPMLPCGSSAARRRRARPPTRLFAPHCTCLVGDGDLETMHLHC
jgi:hypothetical protein